jgi:hypothetical protein
MPISIISTLPVRLRKSKNKPTKSLVFQGFFYALIVIIDQGKSISHAIFAPIRMHGYGTDSLA